MGLFSSKPTKAKTKINKCPYCGAVLTPTSAVCPDCNAEVIGLGASSIIEDFSTQLKEACRRFSRTSVISVIEGFPIPSSRNDLLELLAFLAPKIEPTKTNDYFDDTYDTKAIREAGAYFHKFEECIMKAKVHYANDVAFVPYFKIYKSHKNRKRWKLLIPIIITVISTIVGFLYIALLYINDYGTF